MEFTDILLKGLSAAAKSFAAEVDTLLQQQEDAAVASDDVVNDLRSADAEVEADGPSVKDDDFLDDDASGEITVTSVFGTDDPDAIREMEAPTKFIQPIFVSEDPSLS